MDAGTSSQLLDDYAAVLRSMLPQVRSVCCHAQNGAVFWSNGPVPPGSAAGYRTALDALLAGRGPAAARVELGHSVVYLVGLHNDKDEPLGALAAMMPAAMAQLTADECAERVRPATRILGRELGLRVRLLEGARKLAVQAAEERLLHDVEAAVQGTAECEAILTHILALCRHHLQVQAAALLVPDKKIALVQGDHFTRAELTMLLEDQAATGEQGTEDLYTVGINRADGTPAGLLALAGWGGSGMSDRRRSRVGRYLATHIETVLGRAFDSLTGLTAWPVFEKLLVAALAAESRQAPAVMYCDIDRLHVANDNLGRDVGDQVLVGFARILQEELPGRILTRIASDRFAALLPDTDLEAARRHGEAICGRFRTLEFGHGDRSFRASVSIGIGLAADDSAGGAVNETLTLGGALATAQVACSAAKDRGRGRVEVYQPADLSIIQRFDDIQLAGYIRSAIDRNRLVLLGQPIMPVRPGSPAHSHAYYEVLVRLLDEDGRHVSPAEFISAAERYQLMEDLDRWVISSTLALLGPSRAMRGGARSRFAINLSGQSLGSDSFLAFVQEQLERSGVPPDLLCFEITETVAVANLQRAQAFIHALRRSGCRFSIDDFGTGLSSFAYLKLFPVDTLKIDGSFIRDLTTNVVSQSVVAAISEVARVMKLETVAEYVENEATMAMLAGLNITWAQGYLLGEPAPLGALVEARQQAGASPLAGRPAEQR